MGLNLRPLIDPHLVQLRDLRGEVVAVDIYGMLYQFLTTLRDSRGNVLTDDHGNCISHLIGLVSKTQELLAAGIRPVYVFDGPPHRLKMETLKLRSLGKDAAKAKLAQAILDGDREAIRKFAGQTTYVEQEMVESATALLDACGLPYVMAPQDGEAQCAVMAARGIVDAAASQDYDTLVYGAPRVLRNLTSTKRDTEEVLLPDIDMQHGLNHDMLIDLALLVGNDFHDGIKGVGAKTGAKFLATHGGLGDYLEKLDRSDYQPLGAVERKIAAASAVLRSERIHEIRELFVNPPVAIDVDLHSGRPDATSIHERLYAIHGFSKGRSDAFATTVVDHFEAFQRRGQRRLVV